MTKRLRHYTRHAEDIRDPESLLQSLYFTIIFIVFLVYHLRLPRWINAHLSKNYPVYNTYAAEDKRKMVAIIKAFEYVSPVAAYPSKSIYMLITLSTEQRAIVVEARAQVQKYQYYFRLLILGIALIALPIMFYTIK